MSYLGTGVCGFIGRTVKFQVVFKILLAAFWALSTVFFINIATVIGPTPPGTGVMYEATLLASSKATSPTNLCPDFFVGSKNLIILFNKTVQVLNDTLCRTKRSTI